ncbi:MAG TPA: HAD-IC family P-type ATPase, partial [Thermoanaerobaculaceae bacterium]|nr:HAD-IC family P-type ATPase [Thermoanaerobaculaceae bacterium]
MSAYQGGQPPAEGAWHTLEAGDVATRLGSPEGGLSEVEAARRREQWGPNTLTRRGGDGPWKVLGRQLASPLIWVLLGSSGLAVALGKLTDGLVVLAVVVLNSAIGFVQEYRAGRAIEALAAMAPDRTSVLRGEQVVMLPTSDLVPGDRVILAAGDKIPADLRLLGVTSLQVEEAALTGESVPVPKRIEPVALEAVLGDRTGMAFSGTLVTRGSGVGVVVATGDRTELGRVSSLLEGAADLQTPLTRALAGVARLITAAILVVATVLLAVGMVRAIGAGATIGYALRESVMFAIALAVGAIPEGLPAIVTIALAIGVRRMVVRRAIIRRLPAVETLGSTTVICTDKTGTLTRNEMTAVELWTPSGACEITGVGWEPAGSFVRRGEVVEDIPADLGRLLLHGLLCSDAELAEEGGRWHIVGDPTEAALVVLAAKAGLVASRERLASPRIDALPFSSDTQIMATLHRSGDGPDFVAVKGSPEVILERCQNPEGWPPLEVAEVLAQAERMASRGLRVLAVANREWVSERITLDASDVARGLTFTGLVGLLDPPRPEAIAAVRACQSAGVTVKMITGDHPATARAIAAQIGLGEGAALTGVELARLGPNELRVQARACQVFARVAPEHKLRLVQALQDEGEVVAMTGDGVNDAPALRQADIGVAMGITGTAVAREAADMLITDDNFSSIVAAVEEGRRVYDNLV